MPTVTVSTNETTFVSSAQPNNNFSFYPLMYVGTDVSFQTCISFLKFTIPSLPITGVDSAMLQLSVIVKTGTAPSPIVVNQVTSALDTTTVTYNTQPTFDPTASGINITTADLYTSVQIDVTQIVNEWISGTLTNNGFALTNPDGTTVVQFGTNNIVYQPYFPKLILTYSTNSCTSDMVNEVTQSGDYIINESNTLLLNQRILGTFSVENTGFTNGLAVLQILNGSSIWVDEKSAEVSPGQTKVLSTAASRLDERISIVGIIDPIVSGAVGGTLNANENLFNPNNVPLTFSSDNSDFPVAPNTGVISINNSGSAVITVTTKNIDGPSISFTVIAIGSNSVYNQTQGIFYTTIQQAINAANPGDVLQVGPGNYPENVAIDRQIILNGSGSGVGGTIINPASGVGISISNGGVNSTKRLVISDLQVTGASQGISTIGSNQPSFITLSNVSLLDNLNNGFNINISSSFPVMNDLIITGSNFSNNVTAGFRVPTYAQVSNVTIQNSMFNGNTYGILVFSGTAIFNNINISNSQFNNNTSKGMYYEALNNAFLTNNTINNSGTTGNFAAGIDINLKNGNYQNVNLINNTVTNSGNGDPVNGAAAVIKGRDDGGNNGTLTDLTVSGGTYSDAPVGIRFGETGKNNNYPTNTIVTGATIANNVIGLQNVTTVTITQNNNTFINNGTNIVGNFN